MIERVIKTEYIIERKRKTHDRWIEIDRILWVDSQQEGDRLAKLEITKCIPNNSYDYRIKRVTTFVKVEEISLENDSKEQRIITI